MNCSSACFKDVVLRRHIEKFGRSGFCDFTRRAYERVLPVTSLQGLFKPLLDLYEPFRDSVCNNLPILEGNSLFDCIEHEEGWEIFSNGLSAVTACNLLDALRGIDGKDGDVLSKEEWIYKNHFFKQMHEGWWHEFSKQLKHNRRFIPDVRNRLVGDPRKVLSQYLDKFSYTLVAGKNIYRARIGTDDKCKQGELRPIPPGKKIGAPPAHGATAGRANPTGVSYLYAAEQEATAIQEVRPFIGAPVTVAKFEVLADLKLVSVAKIKHLFSPFLHKDLDHVIQAYDLLEVLNEKLARPVDPSTSHLEYLPTQYLAEVILDNGYDGIRYKSAMSPDGVNLVLFDQSKTAVLETKLVQVAGMTLTYKDVTKYGKRHRRSKVTV